MNSLKGKIALITGATSGIGEASAKRFAMAGAVVFVAGRNVTRGERIVADINKIGGTAFFCKMDVQDDNSIKKAVGVIDDKYGRLDILFNNAGIFPVSPSLEEFSRDKCREILDVNVISVVTVTKECLPLLRKCKGVILNNASVAGLEGYTAGQSYLYCGSKSAVIKITQLIAKKYGMELRANAICPGVVRTPIYNKFDEDRYKNNIPIGRVGEAEDIAAAANFLVSDDAAFINGAILTVDGGQYL